MRILTYTLLSLPLVGAYGLFAIGIVVIYRASRVLNLAHGAMAMVPAYIVYSLVKTFHVPTAISVVLGIAAGALIGLAIERVFVRGLRHMSLTAQTVGTVGALSLLIALAAKIWGTTPLQAPNIFPEGEIEIGAGILRYGAIGLFAVAVVLAIAMLALFRYTDLGLAMRGAADNRRAASLMGIDPDRTAAVAWALGGGLAAISGILLAAIQTLNPFDLPLQTLPAFVAALLGGIDSVGGALVGSSIVGLLIGFVPATSTLPVIRLVTGQTGGPELTLTIAALGVMYRRGQRFAVATRDDGGFTSRKATAAARRRRKVPGPLIAIAATVLVAWVWLPGVPYSVLANINLAMVFTLVGVSLVVLTGWVGQISLGHAALVGIGAFGTGILARDLGVPFPFNLPLAGAMSAMAATLLGAVALRVRGLYLAVATLIFSWMADSFLFRSSWFVGAGGSSTIDNVTFGVRGGFPNFDLTDRKVLYYFALAVTALALLGAANLRSSKTGRAFFATRGSEMAAASLGIDVVRTKLMAFAFSGLLAGLAGNLRMVDLRAISPTDYRFTWSLFFLSIAVVGGLTSLSGIVVAAALFAGLNQLFYSVTGLAGYLDIVSAGLLVAALLAQAKGDVVGRVLGTALRRVRRVAVAAPGVVLAGVPAGGAQSGFGPRRAEREPGAPGPVAVRPAARPPEGAEPSEARQEERAGLAAPSPPIARRRGPAPPEEPRGPRARSPRELVGAIAARLRPSRAPARSFEIDLTGLEEGATGGNGERSGARRDTHIVLEGREITVQFGGLTALSEASIQVREGEIVGLIGPNGAGKTTLFNALSGLNEPTRGRVHLFGRDVSTTPVHERARIGLGRTFQVLQLFSDLSVRDNLLVATHVHNETGFLRHIVASDGALRAEREAHTRVQEAIDALDLHDMADRPVAGLSFGMLRLVELARAVVTEAPIILLDEPASGLDNTETERFSEFLRTLRERMGISMLLIEHDVRMVTGVSDYMYVLNMGQMIAEGTPAQIQRNPAVVAAYLGESAASREAEPAAV